MRFFLIFVILLPLFSFVKLCMFGRKIGVYGAIFISVCNIFSSLLCSVYLFFNFSSDYVIHTSLWKWASLAGFDIFFSLRFDSLTSSMFIVVTLVSACVHAYSCVYMYTDPFLTRFMSYLSLFTFFMLLLVSSNNLLVLFLGWEGVGLCSYLLISFWYTRAQAAKSATKAFLINKIGDLFLLTGVCFIFSVFHTLDFSTLTVLFGFYSTGITEIISIFLFIGAVGKSAQIGLHTWLPDAMEGPTPVSALIHAATMVTAGVFLLIRCSFIFEHAPRVLFFIASIGGLTAFISGTVGVVQNDIKKIIAYSTCSQLGYMVMSCGFSCYSNSLFHLFNHAFFKALLFLSAGSVIHLMSNEQDIRKMGGLAHLSPFVYVSMFIASLALAGFPFLSGFYSKDLIIETAGTKLWVGGLFLYWLSIIAASLTAAYSFKLLDQVFWSDFNGFKSTIYANAKTTHIEFIILTVLLCFAVTSGYLFRDMFVGLGSNFYSFPITVLSFASFVVDVEFLPLSLKLFPLLVTCLVIEFENRFFENKWFYNELISSYLVIPGLLVSRHVFEQYEKNNIELNGPMLLHSIFKNKFFNTY